MAKLDFVEKKLFEELFGMGSGYVLNFSNRTFQAFVYEKIQIDIYQKYTTQLSKANILRAIILDFDDKTVGKLLLELLRYMQLKDMVSKKDSELFKKCASVGNRLIGKSSHVETTQKDTTPAHKSDSVDYEKYLKALVSLTKKDDSPQSRGFAFEKFLKSYFEECGLEPRGSFKIVGEQIDGSFTLHSEVYLLEAKWTNKPISKADLIVFNDKVSSKSSFTRGLFISYSGYTDEALSTFAHGRTVSIILMTVQELTISLTHRSALNDIIWKKVRMLAEEGTFFHEVLS